MISYRTQLVTILAACLTTATALAAGTSPTGTWKWTQPAQVGNPVTERTLTLALKGGKLIGKIMGHQGPQGQMPDNMIREASFKDGTIAFDVEVSSSTSKFVIKYAGQLDGDLIRGTIERPGLNGGAPVKIDWLATRLR